jgi:hypothetical protein
MIHGLLLRNYREGYCNLTLFTRLLDWLAHPPDVPVLLAAMKVKADYLVTFNRKHFIDDPKVAERSDLRIGTPEEALKWVREQWKR